MNPDFEFISINDPTLAHFRHFSHFRHSFNYNIFPIHPFMQNKAKVKSAKINLSSYEVMSYMLLGHLVIQTKANSNPIQSQFKPIQTQFKPISKPNKPNFSALDGDRSEVRYRMSETTCLWQLKFRAHSGIIIELKTADI